MSHKIDLKEGAIIISDAHYSHLRPELYNLIEAIASHKIQTPQLILMGDIFDMLFGGIARTYKANQTLINLLNTLSQKIEIVYLEGNHDFQLKKIFPDIKIIPIQEQPIACSYEGKKVWLAHGDFDGDINYKRYTTFIRNRGVLFTLNIINALFGNFILNKLDSYLAKKDDCKEIEGFENLIKKRMDGKFDGSYFIEGHFHQNKSYTLRGLQYINLAAFACNQRYFVVKSTQDKELLVEQSFAKGIENE